MNTIFAGNLSYSLSSIKLIVNDQDTLQRRQELIDKEYKKYTGLIREDKYEILDQFIREILVSEEEQKSFKQKIDIWDYFIRGGRYHLARILHEVRFKVRN